jgi:hypothetical protein
MAGGISGKEHRGRQLVLPQTCGGWFGQHRNAHRLVRNASDDMIATLSEQGSKISSLPLPRWQKQTAIRRRQRVRDQAGERIGISMSVEHAFESGRSGSVGGCGANGEHRAVMQEGGACRDSVLAGQQSCGNTIRRTNFPGDDGQDGCHDGRKTEHDKAGSGFGGTGFWPCDQNALQRGTLVKGPPVDDVWREMNTLYPISGCAASKTDDWVSRVWARTAAGKVR